MISRGNIAVYLRFRGALLGLNIQSNYTLAIAIFTV